MFIILGLFVYVAYTLLMSDPINCDLLEPRGVSSPGHRKDELQLRVSWAYLVCTKRI